MASTGPLKIKAAKNEEIIEFVKNAARYKQPGEWENVGKWEIGRGKHSGQTAISNTQYHIEISESGKLTCLDKTRNFAVIDKPEKLEKLLDDSTKKAISAWKTLEHLKTLASHIEMSAQIRAQGYTSRIPDKKAHDDAVKEYEAVRTQLDKAGILPREIAVYDKKARQEWKPAATISSRHNLLSLHDTLASNAPHPAQAPESLINVNKEGEAKVERMKRK